MSDVIAPFVVDNRVDRGLHFIGKWIYDAMYVNPVRKAGVLADPRSSWNVHRLPPLEHVHLGHPVANVAGYMLIPPLLRRAWVRCFCHHQRQQAWAGRTAEYGHQLVRPPWVAALPGAVHQPADIYWSSGSTPPPVALLHHDRVRRLVRPRRARHVEHTSRIGASAG